MPTIDELLADRRLGTFHLMDDESPAERLARILPEFGLAPEQVGEIVARYYQDRAAKAGPAITLKRVTKTDNDLIRATTKKTPRELVNPHDPKQGFKGGDLDPEDYFAVRSAFAMQDPEVPGADLRSKADHLVKTMTLDEIKAIGEASIAMSGLNLERIDQLVKN